MSTARLMCARAYNYESNTQKQHTLTHTRTIMHASTRTTTAVAHTCAHIHTHTDIRMVHRECASLPTQTCTERSHVDVVYVEYLDPPLGASSSPIRTLPRTGCLGGPVCPTDLLQIGLPTVTATTPLQCSHPPPRLPARPTSHPAHP